MSLSRLRATTASTPFDCFLARYTFPSRSDVREPRTYGAEVQEALARAWTASNGICGKRLVPFLPELIPTLERHGHLNLSDEVR